MTDPAPGGSGDTGPERKYARIERERRFLLTALPAASSVRVTRRIVDRYLTGTRLRLRHSQRLDHLLATLPTVTLAKTRLSVPPRTPPGTT